MAGNPSSYRLNETRFFYALFFATSRMNTDSTSLQIALATAVAASWSAGGTVDFQSVPVPAVQPQKRAFAIWGLLFPSLAALVSYVGERDVLPDASVHALIGALVGTLAWASLVQSKRYEGAAVMLAASTAFAWIALGRLPRKLSSTTPTLLPRATLGLYAGWLSVATMLMAAVARPRLFDRPNAVAAAALGIGVSALAWRREPFALASVVWALAHRRPPTSTI